MVDGERELTPQRWYRGLFTDVSGAVLLVWALVVLSGLVFSVSGWAASSGVISLSVMVLVRVPVLLLAFLAFGHVVYRWGQEYA